LSGNISNTDCGTRAYKNAEHIRRIASHLIPKEGISSIIPTEILAKLHTVTNPSEVIENKEIATLLERNRLPSPSDTVSRPLFNGTLYFVRITFNTPKGTFSISNADVLTAINYSKHAVKPISRYASLYGRNSANVSDNVIQYSVNLTAMTYNDTDLKGWVNEIVKIPSGSSCLVILNPAYAGIIDLDEAGGINGVHGNGNAPYCFVNVRGQNLTLDDKQTAYARVLSHEIAEMIVNPVSDNPEVCDACAGNCKNVWVDCFDNNDQYIDGSGSLPPPFSYAFYINSIVKPASYDPQTACALPGSDLKLVCVYPPPGGFDQVAGNLSQIRVGADGTVWGINSSQNIFRFDGNQFGNVPGQLTQISVGNSAHVWGLTQQQTIFRFDGNQFNKVDGQLTQISVGADGSVWGINSSQNIFKFVPTFGFTQVAGKLIQVSVGNRANVWGINSAGAIFRFVGNQFNQVAGNLSQIRVGEDGTVWGINSASNIFRFDGNQFVKIDGQLTQISVGNSASVWGINSASNIFRFER
jgi:hypothetical protein